jgi:hypothetical protein
LSFSLNMYMFILYRMYLLAYNINEWVFSLVNITSKHKRGKTKRRTRC